MTTSRFIPAGQILLRMGPYALLLPRRNLLLGAVLTLLLAIASLLALGVGTLWLTPEQIWNGLLQRGPAMPQLLIHGIRLPRICAVLLAGAALGIAGCLLQTLVRNRLATPDMVGVNEGAALAIILFTIQLGIGSWPWWAAPLGSVLAAAALYALCRDPGEQGYRFVVIGIALSELFNALGQLAMSSQPLVHLASLYLWSMGHFAGQGWNTLQPVSLSLLLLCPLLIMLQRPLTLLLLDPASARSLGLMMVPLQLSVLGLAILTAALGTAIGGPVVFIAMAAPIMATSLLRQPGAPLWLAALCGALLLLGSDTLVRLLAYPQELPTGLMTRLLGGLLLLGLLLRRRPSGDN